MQTGENESPHLATKEHSYNCWS